MKKRRICTKIVAGESWWGKAEVFGKQTAVPRTGGTSAQLLATLKAGGRIKMLPFRCMKQLRFGLWAGKSESHAKHLQLLGLER